MSRLVTLKSRLGLEAMMSRLGLETMMTRLGLGRFGPCSSSGRKKTKPLVIITKIKNMIGVRNESKIHSARVKALHGNL